MSSAVTVHRQRTAQVSTFADDNHESYKDFFAAAIISPRWKVLFVLVIIRFALWPLVQYYKKRRARSWLPLDNSYTCDKAFIQPEKDAANLAPAIGATPRAVKRQSLKGPSIPRGSILVMVMLPALAFVLWLHSLLVSLSSGPLEVFQVYRPVVNQGSIYVCNEEVLLVNHVFGFSYDHPFIGYYEPPTCDFDTVRLKLTVTSRGRQFDRLAHMYLGDVEVFRTSTAEPTTDGIFWSYIKDLSQYKVLFKERQKVIFELGNLINDIYTGSFNVTVMAQFSHEKNVETPKIIKPISAQNSLRNSSSAFMIPQQEAKVSYKLDPQTSRAIVSIYACGQSTEEFWWSNVYSSDTETFDDDLGELYGYSPFREIQLYIDGLLAGVVWPYPVIFTGGISPGFWRPIVGTDAFDLRAPEIDITPFLPLLSDGSYHSFEIKIVGLNVSDNGEATLSNTVGSYWVVSGNIFLYQTDSTDVQSSTFASPGQIPEVIAPPPTFTTTRNLLQNRTGGNVSLEYSVRARRTIQTKSTDFMWSQNLSYSNFGLFNQQGLSQKNVQHTSGRVSAGRIGNGDHSEKLSFEYPLAVNTTYGGSDGGLTIDAWMRRGLDINSSGALGVSTYTLLSGPSRLHTTQWGQASYRSSANSTNSSSFGDTSDVFESDAGGRIYQRYVRAVNSSVVADSEKSYDN